MHPKLSVGFVQLNVTGSINRNITCVKNAIGKLTRNKIDLIVLPELWSCGFDYKLLESTAKTTPKLLKDIAKLTKEHEMTIVGSLPEKDKGKIYNTAFVIGPGGDVTCKYRKIHLFPPLKEDVHFAAGEKLATFTVNGVKVGLAICFDIRFPEMIRKLTAQKIKILVVCAQWPKVRYHQWLTLLKARAIENQIFVIAVNRCGIQLNREFLGHSIIINPYGETVYEAHDFEESIDALIDLSLIKRFKEQFDTFALRKPESYDF